MTTNQFNTPILLLVFNRPQLTKKVLKVLKKVKPRKIYIAADGPRIYVPSDQENCLTTRSIVQKLTWPCMKEVLFQKNNLGCGLGPVTGINWFFDKESEGIILEDDCIPDPSFFYFCQALLAHYRDNPKIMHISGNNFQYGKKWGTGSYYFSQYTHSWGWATWRRAWKFNNFNLISPEARKHVWDKQWLLSVARQRGLAIIPSVNLVTNIGTGPKATHTQKSQRYLNVSSRKMKFPLIHPSLVRQNYRADLFTYQNNFGGKTKDFLFEQLFKKIGQL